MFSRRHGPSCRVCVVAGKDDIGDSVDLLSRLPRDSYGQAYLARPEGGPPPALNCPPRVMISWLTVTSEDDAELRTALDAWVTEWGDAGTDCRPTIWIGPSLRHWGSDVDLLPLEMAVTPRAGSVSLTPVNPEHETL